MSSAQISREYRIYLAIWRKALKSEEPVEIKCSSRNMAIAMRQGMYRAIRPFRSGTRIDEELRVASEKFVVFIKDNILEIRPRLTLAELDTMFDEIGIDEEDLLLGDERAKFEELKTFIDDTKIRPTTPYYKREE